MEQFSRYLIDEQPIFFLPTLAVGIGLNEAILLQKIHGWLQCTPKEHVGRNWIYNSYKSWHEQLPFMSESTIKRAMKNLIDNGIVITHNFNKQSFDKTLWYSIDYEKLDETVRTIDSVKMTLRECQNDTTNTNIYYNNKENINNINIINTKERFRKPTLEEVEEYCKERGNSVNPQTFIDFYESKGWKIGKSPMKDWKACVRTWEKNAKVSLSTSKEPLWFEETQDIKLLSKQEQEEMEALINGIC